MKLKHRYHDGIVQSVHYREEEDVIFTVALCGCCNPAPGGQATLMFLGVRNFDEVRSVSEGAQQENQPKGRAIEIVSIMRDAVRCYVVDLFPAGAMTIDAKGFFEA